MNPDSDNSFLFLPDDAFFVKILDASKELNDADCKSLAEAFLESASPLSVEYLSWGFVRKSSKIVLYAASTDRLLKILPEQDIYKTANFACPALSILALGVGTERDAIAKFNQNFVAIKFENAEIKSLSIFTSDPSKSDDDNLTEFLNAEKIALGAYDIYDIVSVKETFSKLRFEIKNNTKNEVIQLKLPLLSFRKNSDVRTQDILKSAAKRRLNGLLANGGIFAILLFFLFLLVWQSKVFLDKFNVSKLEEELLTLSPASQKILEMNEQLNYLNSFSKEALFNVRLLAIVNQYRPKDVVFSKSLANTSNALDIEGVAQSIDSVNVYQEALLADPFIADAEMNILNSKSGATRFRLKLKFNF